MVFRRRLLIYLAAITIIVGVSSENTRLYAQSVGTIDIRVEGAQRIEPDTVRSYVPIRAGQKITTQALDEALKKLFATGLFADVIVRREGSAIVVRVVENPIINRIAFEGNKRVSNDILEDEVKLRPRIVYTRSRVQNDVQRLIDVYRRNGRFAVTVEPKVIQLPQNRVDLIFEITEGPVTEIRRIGFVGNVKYSDSDLRSVVRTKETAWYRFLTADDIYDPDRLTFDRELLRRFYLSNGYADFRVVSAIAELAPNREGFFITFTIEEGERYRFGKIDVAAKLRDLSSDQLKGLIKVKNGDWYNADVVKNVVLNLTDAVSTLGYAFVDIRPRVKRKKKERVIDITFRVREGPRVFVERIDITGNVRTIDSVIRREMVLVEGDAFNASKTRRARKKIRNLGFFEKVDVKNVVGSRPDKTVLQVKVRERSTGEISFGAGFSTTNGFLGNVGIRERNLLGKGQDLLLKTTIAAESSEIDLQFTEPYFLDRKLSGGFDLFRTTKDLQDESSFQRKSFGAGLRLGFEYSDIFRQRLRYRITREEVTDVASIASLAIQEQEGAAVKSEISQILTYDGRDDLFLPTKGVVARFNTALAGLGGVVKYIRTNVKATKYFPITEKFIGSIGGSAGYIIGLGKEIRIVDRFFLGGPSLRGFSVAGAGPRDETTGDSVGGKFFYRGSAQVTFPIGLPSEFGVKGRMFSDIGSLSNSESTLATITDEKSLRASVGFGLSWRSPFGPILLDFSKALLKEDFDKTEVFRFDFGVKF
ncbi:MAG: outer membrane protein assembly factor BamA [Alphaproteobacteria bacterium]